MFNSQVEGPAFRKGHSHICTVKARLRRQFPLHHISGGSREGQGKAPLGTTARVIPGSQTTTEPHLSPRQTPLKATNQSSQPLPGPDVSSTGSQAPLPVEVGAKYPPGARVLASSGGVGGSPGSGQELRGGLERSEQTTVTGIGGQGGKSPLASLRTSQRPEALAQHMKASGPTPRAHGIGESRGARVQSVEPRQEICSHHQSQRQHAGHAAGRKVFLRAAWGLYQGPDPTGSEPDSKHKGSHQRELQGQSALSCSSNGDPRPASGHRASVRVSNSKSAASGLLAPRHRRADHAQEAPSGLNPQPQDARFPFPRTWQLPSPLLSDLSQSSGSGTKEHMLCGSTSRTFRSRQN